MPTPREAFAELSVNGQFFGFYGIEEHVDADWFACNGWEPSVTSLYKANSGCDWSTAANGWEQKLPARCPEPAEPASRGGRRQLFGAPPPPPLPSYCDPPRPSVAADLGQLFSELQRVSSLGTNSKLEQMAATMNMTNFFICELRRRRHACPTGLCLLLLEIASSCFALRCRANGHGPEYEH